MADRCGRAIELDQIIRCGGLLGGHMLMVRTQKNLTRLFMDRKFPRGNKDDGNDFLEFVWSHS